MTDDNKKMDPETAEEVVEETVQDTEEVKEGETVAEETAETAGDAETAAGSEAEDSEEKAKPDKKDQQIEALNDKYIRLFAEFDNFRKRTDGEKASMFAEGEKTVLLKVLPLIDNFERALATIPEDQKGSPLAEGIEKVYKSFIDQLTDLGVTPIEAVGQQFDANLHNAVMHLEDENVPENTVVEEFQKGYMFKEKVLRYSMVKVAN